MANKAHIQTWDFFFHNHFALLSSSSPFLCSKNSCALLGIVTPQIFISCHFQIWSTCFVLGISEKGGVWGGWNRGWQWEFPHCPLPQVLVESIHGQEVDVRQKHVWCADVLHGHVPEQVHRVELPLLVHDVVANIVAAHQDFWALSVAQELLGFCIGKVECQADGTFPVLADGFKHLEPGRGRVRVRKSYFSVWDSVPAFTWSNADIFL